MTALPYANLPSAVSNMGTVPVGVVRKEGEIMARKIKDYRCKRCGYLRRAFATPRACSSCEGRNTFEKREHLRELLGDGTADLLDRSYIKF